MITVPTVTARFMGPVEPMRPAGPRKPGCRLVDTGVAVRLTAYC